MSVMKKYNHEIAIDGVKIGIEYPTYFIADIGANHDGDIERAKDLIYLCAESGAQAAKFQHFTAETIVSDYGFKKIDLKNNHQLSWKKSVYEIYKDASINVEWTAILQDTCKKVGITFFTSPYSVELVEVVDQYVSAYKIGSGDITWLEIIEYIANKNKPVLLATGASCLNEVSNAIDHIIKLNKDIVLMQCNTNYTASLENFKYINLNVLNTYKSMYPNMILGLSDHTPGCATVLGAVTLGARVIEKHFTDSNDRVGPDHKFAMDPRAWKYMIDRTRELEHALGCGLKQVEQNEEETVILQRRSIRIAKDVVIGDVLTAEHVVCLRPCPDDAIEPYNLKEVIGKMISRDIKNGDYLQWKDLS